MTEKVDIHFIHRPIFIIGLLLLILAFFSPNLRAQRKVIIEQSDVLKFDKRNGQNVQKIIGNVILRQETTRFYCDSAILDNSNDKLYAYGDVHIDYNDSVDVYGRYLEYDGAQRIAYLDTNARMVDNRATLSSDRLIYNRTSRWAYYDSGGKIVDDDNVLTSIIGRYYTSTKELFFRDSVVLTNPDFVLKSDTLMYNTDTEIVYIYGPTTIEGDEDFIYAEGGWFDTQNDVTELKQNAYVSHLEQSLSADEIFFDRQRDYGNARGNISLFDSVQDVVVKGNIAEFDRQAGYSYITDSALAILIDGEDSLFMHSDTMWVMTDTNGRATHLFAYYHLKFYRDDLQGKCDSMVYNIIDSVIHLYNAPALWAAENQLTADSIKLYISENRIDSLKLFSDSFIISEDDSLQFNQIKGREMTALFNKNQLSQIIVIGNAETLYFVRDENEEMMGINRSVSSSMRIVVVDNEVKKIIYIDQPDAAINPEDEVESKDLILRGFKWISEFRPMNMSDIFSWYELE